MAIAPHQPDFRYGPNGIHQPDISDAEDNARELMGYHARTFNFSARFLPAEKRQAVVWLYAFCRTVDDIIDERGPGWDANEARDELAAWRGWLLGNRASAGPREPLASQLGQVIAEYRIPVEYLLHLLDGLESDLGPRAIADFGELRQYCYRVASTVGLAMAHILGATSPAALAAAEELGVAMQLTNILRDVGRDLSCELVYLPKIELVRFDLSHDDLTRLYRSGRGPDERFRALMRYQVERAHRHYQHGTPGIWLLPPDCRFPILLATRLYRRILTVIEHQRYDTLRQRAVTSRWVKAQEAAIAFSINSLWSRGERAATVTAAISLPSGVVVEGVDAAVPQ